MWGLEPEHPLPRRPGTRNRATSQSPSAGSWNQATVQPVLIEKKKKIGGCGDSNQNVLFRGGRLAGEQVVGAGVGAFLELVHLAHAVHRVAAAVASPVAAAGVRVGRVAAARQVRVDVQRPVEAHRLGHGQVRLQFQRRLRDRNVFLIVDAADERWRSSHRNEMVAVSKHDH